METAVKETSLIELDNLDAKMLPELKGWKEKQLQIVKENPFIKIEDNKTYEEAKKHRTALVTARTSLQNQEKTVASKIAKLRKQVATTTNELIAITLPHEEKQQEEVKVYEAKKEAERLEKERIERERKEAIRDNINEVYNYFKHEIAALTFPLIEDLKKTMDESLSKEAESEMEEYELDFAEKVNLLNSQFEERVKYLNEQEESRKERERLAAERKAFEDQKAKEEAERKAREAKEKAEREEHEEKIRKDREALEAEKQKLAREEAERQAKIEAERKAKEAAKAKAEAEKRAKELQPDKIKAEQFIKSLGFSEELPTVKDSVMKSYLEYCLNDLKQFQSKLISRLNEIK